MNPDHDAVIYFYNPNDKYGALSNFYPLKHGLVYQNKTYRTSEHLYQALRWIYEGASEDTLAYAEEIRNAATPAIAKMLSNQTRRRLYEWQKNAWIIINKYDDLGVCPRPDWHDIKLTVMEHVLDLKFQCFDVPREVLIFTKSRPLVERTTKDSFWADGGDGTGQNWLGKLLMKVRDRIINSE